VNLSISYPSLVALVHRAYVTGIRDERSRRDVLKPKPEEKSHYLELRT